jgi:hypothetical protein
MTDPVQMLIDAGAIPASPFSPSSRYANVVIVRYRSSSADLGTPYVSRRFVPRLRDIAVGTTHTLRAGDRIDLLAAHYLGDVEFHWRIADANAVSDMLELTATPGLRIGIPLPPGVAGG